MANESDIDRLFQLPLTEFTAARNALAKAAGKDGAAIRELGKPPLAAWAVNQLYWQDRDTYEALIAAASEMRQTHKAVIEGKRGDLRVAGREHDVALDAALKSTLSILKESGNPVTESTRQAILNTLRALPADEPPGRLTRALAPGGFEMLAGITPAAVPKRAAAPAAKARGAAEAKRDDDAQAKEAARRREARAAAERALRDADQKARHAEFEAARAARDATKAARRLEAARKALEEAQSEVEEAEADAERAEEAREAAERRSSEAQDALEAARARLASVTA
jgi:hypothetical protein